MVISFSSPGSQYTDIFVEEFGQFLKKCYDLRNNDKGKVAHTSLEVDTKELETNRSLPVNLCHHLQPVENENKAQEVSNYKRVRVLAEPGFGQCGKIDPHTVSLSLSQSFSQLTPRIDHRVQTNNHHNHTYYIASFKRHIIPDAIFMSNIDHYMHVTHTLPTWGFVDKYYEVF